MQLVVLVWCTWMISLSCPQHLRVMLTHCEMYDTAEKSTDILKAKNLCGPKEGLNYGILHWC